MTTPRQSAESVTPQQVALRRQAEARLSLLPGDLAALSPAETQRQLHELRVHQIELEMQNEELRRAQVELDAARARYFDLYDLAPVGYVAVSASGLILEANLTAATLLGVARGALVGQRFSQFIAREDQDLYYGYRKRLLATPATAPASAPAVPAGKAQECELRLVRPGAAARWTHLEATAEENASGDGGSGIGLRIVLSDISERKRTEAELARLESQLQQAQKMESVGRLAGGVAHDFNNLLMGIMNYVELCRDELPPEHAIRGYLDEVTSDAQRSAGIVRQLLAFARKQIIAPKVLDLNESVTATLKLLRHLLGENITLFWLPGAALWRVKLDPAQLDQILANLAANARDAIGGAGKLIIETRNTTLDAAYCAEHADALPGEYVMLMVNDNGCGMDKETLAHLFDPFFTTKAVGEGTGLGLATVYGIVRQNNGCVDVQSKPGEGATFRLFLPRCAAEPAPAATPPPERPGGTETILLVEDEKSVRVTTSQLLGLLGYTVLAAGAPEEALRLAAKHAGVIDLLITDVVMPGLSGRDLAERLTEQRPTLKRLFMSGYPAELIAYRGVMGQNVHFLAKPFTRDALAQKVREVLEKK
jgi:signal transduction histidine kinase